MCAWTNQFLWLNQSGSYKCAQRKFKCWNKVIQGVVIWVLSFRRSHAFPFPVWRIGFCTQLAEACDGKRHWQANAIWEGQGQRCGLAFMLQGERTRFYDRWLRLKTMVLLFQSYRWICELISLSRKSALRHVAETVFRLIVRCRIAPIHLAINTWHVSSLESWQASLVSTYQLGFSLVP